MRSSIHSPAYAALRELLIAARRTAGLSQEDVARRLGRPQSFVAKYEGGERKLDVIEFIALARALEQDPVQLFESLAEATKG
jgi:transcriptional regulator with XRE-family HTH domain